MPGFQPGDVSSILVFCTNFALVMEMVYILDSKSKFSRFESWLGYKLTGGLLKLVKRMLLKSIRSVMSWRGGSNPSTSAKRMFTDTLGTQLSTP